MGPWTSQDANGTAWELVDPDFLPIDRQGFHLGVRSSNTNINDVATPDL